MDITGELREIASRIPDLRGKIETEEATKQYLVLPLIKALGYDVFNPSEVVPEYIADLPGIKTQKADYALFKALTPHYVGNRFSLSLASKSRTFLGISIIMLSLP